MESKDISRRVLLERSAQLPIAGFLMLAAGSSQVKAADDGVCVDFENLDAGQRSIRQSLEYVNEAPDESMSCAKCGFFTPTEGGCGSCLIFSGVADGRGWCVSWSPKS